MIEAYWYGEPGSGAALRREFIHQHIVSQRGIAFALPTNVRAIYYAGKHICWPGDKDVKPAPGRTTVRKPGQNVSDACQWLIDQGYVGEDEIVDADGHLESYVGVANVLDYVRRASHVMLDPWSPNPVPTILCEGRNDLALVRPIGEQRRLRWVALGGMGGRGHLRRVTATLPSDTPIGYVGDANRSGRDIERNAEKVLTDRGWNGTWTRLLITDDQAAELNPVDVTDGRDGRVATSVETAAMPVPQARRIITDWLDVLVPDVPDADESKRAAIIAALAEL